MRLGLILCLLAAGCSRHWSDSYGRLRYPARVGYEFGVEAAPSNGQSPDLAVRRHTAEGRVRDTHPQVARHDGADWLYFASDRYGDGFNLYRKRFGTHAVERLTHLEGDEHWPRVSRDGRWLAFGGNARGHWDLYLLDLHNLRVPQLLTAASRQDSIQPGWSGDGGKLVYASHSPTLEQWVIRGITFGASDRWNPPAPKPTGPGGGTLVSVEDAKGAARPAPVSSGDLELRKVASRWTLYSASQTPITGLHPVYRPVGKELLVYQDYRRDLEGWYGIKLYDFATGLTTAITPARGYGAIQPSFSEDGAMLVYLTVGKGDREMESGDGMAICDLTGQVVADLRNPLRRGRLTDPALVTIGGEQRLIFGVLGEEGEAIYSVRVGG